MKNQLRVQRKSECELVVTREANAPARLVFEAWIKPELFRRWWVPKSIGMTLLECELDVRVGGNYRLVFSHPAAPNPMEFFGTYLDVIPHSRIVWTNEEGGENAQVTTITFEEQHGKTLLTVHELYPSKAALDEAISSESVSWNNETFDQLDELFANHGPSSGK